MSAHGQHWAAVFDGVSGVTEVGLRPEDASYGLRAAVAKHMDTRAAPNVDSTEFDQKVRDELGVPNVRNVPRGDWMKNLIALS